MKVNRLIVPLMLFSTTTFCGENLSVKTEYVNPAPHTLIKTYNNESTRLIQGMQRSIDYPTQIIRMHADVSGHQLTCDEVNTRIEQVLLSHITKEQFVYNTLVKCHFDPQTMYATYYDINNHFDPINDRAVRYLTSYLEQ